MSPRLKMALDMGPVLVFVAGYWLFGIFVATALVMLTIACAVGIEFALERKVSPMLLITFVLVLIFGSLTLWLTNEVFIKMKPTILYGMFACVLAGGLLSDRVFLKYVLGNAFSLSEHGWRALTWRWSSFFVALAIANELVWRTASTDTWVAFKLGVIPLTMIFALAQTPFILRNQTEGDKSPPVS
jgi:intracellular septation protein